MRLRVPIVFLWSAMAHSHNDEEENQRQRKQPRRPRCATEEPSWLDKWMTHRTVQTYRIQQQKRAAEKRGMPLEPPQQLFIPVYWHIITDDDWVGGYLSDSQIDDQLRVLNDAFAGTPGNSVFPTDCYGQWLPNYGSSSDYHYHNIAFYTASIEYHANSEWFLFQGSPTDSPYRAATRRGGCGDLNVWTTALSYQQNGALGHSTLPRHCRSSTANDGVILDVTTVPGYSTLTNNHHNDNDNDNDNYEPYTQGDTMVHEVGHWLGLYHTFEGACSSSSSSSTSQNCGDQVDDTPPERSASYGCPLQPNLCDVTAIPTHMDAVHNYMNYVDDCCMHRFTAGQRERMHALYQQYRTNVA